ncbi:Ribonuclease T2 precursor (RNase T2) [Entomophthora muscae]|uniref:Ribonuclease T2 (RNase T2) n=1 Tax=Entomophthora muscae TaxID=34485 RepID=A0ACC2T0C7_9FUNG|nr:Ribonuclease T2 precursor (RNase T2) [Entomophthora muscae]
MDKFMLHGYDALVMRQNLFPTSVLKKSKDENCPLTARSCTFKRHGGCCVPTLGRIVFSQIWDPYEPIDAFTIHGLWPSDCRTGQAPPNGCGEPSSIASISAAVQVDPTLHQVMSTYWPSKSGSLWANEWNKHGTCLSTVETRCYDNDSHPNDAIRYFKVSLSLYSQFDIMEELRPKKIVPGNNYTRKDFFNAMSHWKGSVGLYCRSNELSEIRFALFGRPKHQFAFRPKPNDGSCPDEFLFPIKRSRKPIKQNPPKSKPDPSVVHYRHDELK